MFCIRAEALARRDGTACTRHLARRQTTAGKRCSRSRTSAPICRRRCLPRCDDISIDYAVMEKSARVAVVPASFGWSDVGSWKAVSELVDADASGNRAQGECVFIDSSNCYVQSSGRLVAAVGVDGLMVIDTPDALLVAHQDHVQDVKKVAQQLKLANHETYKIHRTVLRPWGSYTVSGGRPRLQDQAHRGQTRRLAEPADALPPQRALGRRVRYRHGHQRRQRRCSCARTNRLSFPAGHRHRLENPGKLDLVMIEVQSGNYLGEDDIVRFEDQLRPRLRHPRHESSHLTVVVAEPAHVTLDAVRPTACSGEKPTASRRSSTSA